jgi:hypothetical protein
MHREIGWIFCWIIDAVGVCFYLVSILLSVSPLDISGGIGLFFLIPEFDVICNILYFYEVGQEEDYDWVKNKINQDKDVRIVTWVLM